MRPIKETIEGMTFDLDRDQINSLICYLAECGLTPCRPFIEEWRTLNHLGTIFFPGDKVRLVDGKWDYIWEHKVLDVFPCGPECRKATGSTQVVRIDNYPYFGLVLSKDLIRCTL